MTSEIKALTSLRGVAAFMVVIYHARLLDDWQFGLDRYTAIFSRSYLWVDFFFILSGFILAYVYGRSFEGAFSAAKYRNFLVRRLRRIYPLHLATLLLFVPLVLHDVLADQARYPAGIYLRSFFENLFLVQSWHDHDIVAWNAPSWSISSEWAAYLLFPLAFYVVYRGPLVLAGGVVVLGVLCLYVMSTFAPREILDIMFGFGTLRCLAGFCLGILICRLYRLNHLYRAYPGVTVIGSDGACAGVLVLIFVLLHTSGHDIWLVPAFAVLILSAALNRGRMKRIFETPVLYQLGLISYSLYMTHWFVYQVALGVRDRWLGAEPDGLALAGLMTGAVALTVALSIVTYRHVEQPFRHWPWRRRPAAACAPVRP
jgi:peptidoglycan/LPS O-acetylase OafA/YrhL